MGKTHSKETFTQWDLDRFSNVAGRWIASRIYVRRRSSSRYSPCHGWETLPRVRCHHRQRQPYGQEGIPSSVQGIVHHRTHRHQCSSCDQRTRFGKNLRPSVQSFWCWWIRYERFIRSPIDTNRSLFSLSGKLTFEGTVTTPSSARNKSSTWVWFPLEFVNAYLLINEQSTTAKVTPRDRLTYVLDHNNPTPGKTMPIELLLP